MKVLVAEDDPIHRRLLQGNLEKWGYEVVLAADGILAWNILDQNDSPEMVILDWMMPGLSGDEICRLVRQRSSAHYTYMLLVSARSNKADLLQGLEAGADDYIVKPFDPLELKARLNTGKRILRLQNELIEAREAMRRQATRDGLTDLWNHAAILEILQRELHRSLREGKPVGVLFADLDHFKMVNDTHGHLTGDATLRQVAFQMMNAMRPYDLIGRYGGEEFLIVLPGCDESATLGVCDRIRSKVANHLFSSETATFHVTMSCGATVYFPAANLKTEEILRIADRALYRAKDAGRDRIEFIPAS